jgi:hypothetical protein|tara:strand:- start:5 stop:601 length:597 start_codon:yes stop_codon:yes gene_type:complete
MARKSKAKFIMKRKGFPGSSAFQQEENPVDVPKTKLGDVDDYDPKLNFDVEDGQKEFSGTKQGWGYAAFELAQLAKRRKAAKAKKALAEQEELNRLSKEAVDQSHLENEYQMGNVYDPTKDEFGNPIETEEPEVIKKDLPEVTVKPEDYKITDDKNEMTNLRSSIQDMGTWDPKTNTEHAKIQNKINELYGSSVRYPV